MNRRTVSAVSVTPQHVGLLGSGMYVGGAHRGGNDASSVSTLYLYRLYILNRTTRNTGFSACTPGCWLVEPSIVPLLPGRRDAACPAPRPHRARASENNDRNPFGYRNRRTNDPVVQAAASGRNAAGTTRRQFSAPWAIPAGHSRVTGPRVALKRHAYRTPRCGAPCYRTANHLPNQLSGEGVVRKNSRFSDEGTPPTG